MKRLSSILLPILILASGCERSTGPNVDAHVGTYEAISVNGTALPATLFVEDGVTYTLLNGTLNLNADRTASASLRIRTSQATVVLEETASNTGTYTRGGTSIVIQWADGTSNVLVYDERSDELTFTQDGAVVLFRK